MNNNKMIKTAKNLDTLANVFGKISVCAGIVHIVVALLVLVIGGKMIAQGATSLDLDFVKLHLAQGWPVDEKFVKLYAFAASLGGGIICFAAGYCAFLFHKILLPMKEGRPFEDGISLNLRKMGWAVLAGGLLKEFTGVAARALFAKAYSVTELFTAEAVTKTEFVFTMNFDFVVVTCVILFLSYIFSYGQMLQKESDETL